MSSSGSSKVAEQLRRQEDRTICLQLRIEGLDIPEISILTGIGEKDVKSLIRAGLQRLRDLETEAAEELRQMQFLRLEKLLNALWEKAMKGNLGAVDRILAILDRENRLMRLEKSPLQPGSVEAETLDQLIENEIVKLLALRTAVQKETSDGGIVEGSYAFIGERPEELAGVAEEGVSGEAPREGESGEGVL
jgi:hypothetical protein